jgi:hypothetical protein
LFISGLGLGLLHIVPRSLPALGMKNHL